MSSDGRWLGYIGRDSAGANVSGIVELRPGVPLRLVAAWDSLEVVGWATNDRLLYLLRRVGPRSQDLLEVPFDPSSGALAGVPDVIYPRLRAAEVAITTDGRRLVFTDGSSSANLQEVTLDRTPRLEDNPSRLLTAGTALWAPVSYAPTGELLAALSTDTRFEIFRIQPDGTRASEFSRSGMMDGGRFIFGSPDGTKVAWWDFADPNHLNVDDLRAPNDRTITLPFRSSDWSFSEDGARLAGMSSGELRRILVVDSGATTARILDLDGGEACEFSDETTDIGPEWPWAAISSERDLWVVNLETGALRKVADQTWSVVGWRGPWIYFYRTIGQTGNETPVMFRVPAAGGNEERVLDMPLACGQQPLAAISHDATRWTCAAVSNLLDITVVEITPRRP